MNTFSYPNSSEKNHQTDPLLYTYDMKNEININNDENLDAIQSDKKEDLNEYMKFDGQGTKDIKNVLNEDDKEGDKEEDTQKEEEKNMINRLRGSPITIGTIEEEIKFVDKKKDENYEEYKNYNEGQDDDDEYYFISELVPPQNFSSKLRFAKKRYQELQKKIYLLKKEIKKYNPNYPVRDYNYYK